jgi:uncharacterized YigZ family protein
MEDSYTSIAAPATAEIKVKGSRFIAEAIPVRTEEEADEHIAAIRRREYAATHHCTAWRIGPGPDAFRCNDDGEPSGTAGQPILRQIDGRNLTNVLVVVTRYYGGTKLGAGGLIRAYGDAAAEVLDRCRRVDHILRLPLQLRFAYDDTSAAMHTIGRFDALIVDTQYGQDTLIEVAVRRSQAEALAAAFVEALGGRGEVIDGSSTDS